MSRDRNVGRTHSMKIDNISFESVDEFKYLGTTLTNQNSIQEEINNWGRGHLNCLNCLNARSRGF